VLITGHNPLIPSDDKGFKPDMGVPDMRVPDMMAPDAGVPDQGTTKPDQQVTTRDQAITQKDKGVTQKDKGVTQKDKGVAHGDAGITRKGIYFFGGGGCAVSGTSGGDGLGGLLLALFPLALLVVVRRRRRLQRLNGGKGLPGVLLVALLLLSATPARAQKAALATANFNPTAVQNMNYFVTEEAKTLPHLVPAVGLMLNYAHRPLMLWDDAKGEVFSSLVAHKLGMDVMFAMGFFDRVELGIVLPVALYQDGDDLGVIGRAGGGSVGTALGDLRIDPKVRVVSLGPVDLGVALDFTVPTGSQKNFLGEDSLTFTPKLLVSLDTRMVDVGLNMGYRLRSDTSFQVPGTQNYVNIDDEIVVSLGTKVAVWKDTMDLIVDGFMSLSTHEQNKEEIPAEVLAGARCRRASWPRWAPDRASPAGWARRCSGSSRVWATPTSRRPRRRPRWTGTRTRTAS